MEKDKKVTEVSGVEESYQDKLKRNYEREKKALHDARDSRMWAYLCCVLLSVGIVVLSLGALYVVRQVEVGQLAEQQPARQEAEAALQAEKEQLAQEREAALQAWKEQTFQDVWSNYSRRLGVSSTVLGSDNREELNQYIASLKRHAASKEEINRLGEIPFYQSSWIYDIQRYVLADGSNTVIFPGAVLKGDSLCQGTSSYTLLPLERTDMYLTSTQINGGESRLVENPSYRTVSDVLKVYAQQNEGSQSQSMDYYMQSIHSLDELKFSLGVELPGVVDISFGAGTSQESSSLLINYVQTYYTVTADPLKSAVDYFREGTDMAALGDYEPAYVATVNYGRMVTVLVQGSMSSSELEASVGACVQGVNIGADIAKLSKDENLTLRLSVSGGKMIDLNEFMGISVDRQPEPEKEEKKGGFVGWWNNLWNKDNKDEKAEDETSALNAMAASINAAIDTDAPTTNPVPIAYTLKYLSDNSFVPAIVSKEESVTLDTELMYLEANEQEVTELEVIIATEEPEEEEKEGGIKGWWKRWWSKDNKESSQDK